ncbi:MAG TPA: transposase [Trebonia sp.]|nr:transposase [Trebonia sp.]
MEEQANPEGAICVITDNLSSHDSKSTLTWLEDHPRMRHAFIPKGACWLNPQEGWWRIFRKSALAGQTLADLDEIAHATQVATARLNARAGPGSGDDPSPSTAPTAAALYTSFKRTWH